VRGQGERRGLGKLFIENLSWFFDVSVFRLNCFHFLWGSPPFQIMSRDDQFCLDLENLILEELLSSFETIQ
jgi:hypothetical protein